MKFVQRALALLLCVVSVNSCVNAPRPENLFGVWSGETGNVLLVFRFFHDGRCEFRFEDAESGSAQLINGNMEIDFSKTPIPLTVRNIPQLTHSVHTIVEFLDDDTMRMAAFATRWRLRPIAFDPSTSMTLNRVD
ncbi:MAG TPA: hypothetical protein VLK65_24675, partial [Vicinamibacteria bacterium]|nr:hypothetical protein [Vicinamibacteria bacterium]